jgi:pentatricopeptide repeat protein
MIGSYVSCGKFKEPLGMFSRMMELGVEPDEATLVETFSAGFFIGCIRFWEMGSFMY